MASLEDLQAEKERIQALRDTATSPEMIAALDSELARIQAQIEKKEP